MYTFVGCFLGLCLLNHQKVPLRMGRHIVKYLLGRSTKPPTPRVRLLRPELCSSRKAMPVA